MVKPIKKVSKSVKSKPVGVSSKKTVKKVETKKPVVKKSVAPVKKTVVAKNTSKAKVVTKKVAPAKKVAPSKVKNVSKKVSVSKTFVAKSSSATKINVKKKKFSIRSVILIVTLLLLVAGSVITFSYKTKKIKAPKVIKPIADKLTIKKKKFFVKSEDKKVNKATLLLEIADTDPARLQGLIGREKLEENSGMLFDFEEPGYYSMWMKGMTFPLDMVFLNNKHKVIVLAPDRSAMDEKLITPCSVEFEKANSKNKNAVYKEWENKYSKPENSTRYVLELPAGTIKKNNIMVGDILSKK